MMLDVLTKHTGHPCDKFRVHRIPLDGQVSYEERTDKAAQVLGVTSLLRQDASPPNVQRRRELLLKRAKFSMRNLDRIPLSTTELWLALEGQGAEPERVDETVPEHMASGGERTDAKLLTVEVTCQATSAKQFTSKIIQVMMPLGSDVGTLRAILDKDLPQTAQILEPGKEHALRDNDPAPQKVVVTEFKGRRQMYLRFTRQQCARVLDMLRTVFERTEIQAKLDELEREAMGDQNKQRLLLSEVLMQEAYPDIMRLFNVPCTKPQSLFLLPSAMYEVDRHLDLLELHAKVEHIMRNWRAAHEAQGRYQKLRQELNLPPL